MTAQIINLQEWRMTHSVQPSLCCPMLPALLLAMLCQMRFVLACWGYCGARGVPLECDHVFPISKGGSNEDDNLVAACVPCNRSKGANTPEQWRGE